MQRLESGGTSVLYIGRTVLKGYIPPQPPWRNSPFIEASRLHTEHNTFCRVPLDEWSSWRRYLSTYKTHNTHKRDILASSWIQTRNPSKRAAADPRLRSLTFHFTTYNYQKIEANLEDNFVFLHAAENYWVLTRELKVISQLHVGTQLPMGMLFNYGRVNYGGLTTLNVWTWLFRLTSHDDHPNTRWPYQPPVSFTQMRLKLTTAPLKIKIPLFRAVRPSFWLSIIPLPGIWRRTDG
jgi:hypothetical protein